MGSVGGKALCGIDVMITHPMATEMQDDSDGWDYTDQIPDPTLLCCH